MPQRHFELEKDATKSPKLLWQGTSEHSFVSPFMFRSTWTKPQEMAKLLKYIVWKDLYAISVIVKIDFYAISVKINSLWGLRLCGRKFVKWYCRRKMLPPAPPPLRTGLNVTPVVDEKSTQPRTHAHLPQTSTS